MPVAAPPITKAASNGSPKFLVSILAMGLNAVLLF
jgi:hypothetical protein